MQAVFVGAAWGAVVGIATGLVTVWLAWPWWLVALAVIATWAAITAWHLTAGVRLRQSLLWKREEIERRDLDGDGHVGQPPVTVRVEVATDDGTIKRTQFLNLDTDPERLILFARSVLAGRGLAIHEWTGRGGLFSRSEFERLRGDLLERGLVGWANPKDRRQGVQLTPTGRAVFRKLADLPQPPPHPDRLEAGRGQRVTHTQTHTHKSAHQSR